MWTARLSYYVSNKEQIYKVTITGETFMEVCQEVEDYGDSIVEVLIQKEGVRK